MSYMIIYTYIESHKVADDRERSVTRLELTRRRGATHTFVGVPPASASASRPPRQSVSQADRQAVGRSASRAECCKSEMS